MLLHVNALLIYKKTKLMYQFIALKVFKSMKRIPLLNFLWSCCGFKFLENSIGRVLLWPWKYSGQLQETGRSTPVIHPWWGDSCELTYFECSTCEYQCIILSMGWFFSIFGIIEVYQSSKSVYKNFTLFDSNCCHIYKSLRELIIVANINL